MPSLTLNTLETTEERSALDRFKTGHPELFAKDEKKLSQHLITVIGLLCVSTLCSIVFPSLWLKLPFAVTSAFFWFCLINVTIHHHQTHKNAASSPAMKKVMDIIFFMAVPNAPKRRGRYTRAHLNHHLRPFHETDVDHHYGVQRFLEKTKTLGSAFLYYLELTVVGAHVPGWEDDKYMNTVPLEKWNQKDYEEVKKREKTEALKSAVLQWGGFLAAAWILPAFGIFPRLLSGIAWGWALPMLLVKNWSHFLGQFQHYETNFLNESTIHRKTKSFHFPGWMNWLTGGEISGHFLHHLYPEMPYYNVEAARKIFATDSQMAQAFLIY
jgi:fatty acid desaturase